MMIVGIAGSAVVTGKLLDPFSLDRLLLVACGVGAVAFLLSVFAVSGGLAQRTDARTGAGAAAAPDAAELPFADAVRAALAEPATRRFVGFVFLAMLAFSAQDLILEPFAGTVFAMTPGQTTQLGGMQHGGVLLGMLVAAWLSQRVGTLRGWAAGGCFASALAFVALSQTPSIGSVPMLQTVVFVLGVSNGCSPSAAWGR
jgi:BCD family chlorophyll transporter-like MFS transporter